MKVLKKVFKFYRFLIWKFCRIFPFIKIKANSIQGKFCIPRDALRANDYIHYSLYVNKYFEYDIYIRSVNFLKAKGLLKETGNKLLDIGVNNGVISIGSILAKDFDFSIGVDGCEEHIESCRKNLKLNNIENSVKLFHKLFLIKNVWFLFRNQKPTLVNIP